MDIATWPGRGSACVRKLLDMLFTVYRVLAYVTGVVLLALVLVAMPLKYIWHHPEPTSVVGMIHGYLFAVYAVVAFLLGYVRRWRWLRILLVVLAGTIPFASFYAERKLAAQEREPAPADS
jgi:integral membrane protein